MVTTEDVREQAIYNISEYVDQHKMLDDVAILQSVLKDFDLIEKAKCVYGDEVDVLNYRKKPAVWERGIVREVSYSSLFKEFNWSYRVVLNRPSPTGKSIGLSVRSSSIRKP